MLSLLREKYCLYADALMKNLKILKENVQRKVLGFTFFLWIFSKKLFNQIDTHFLRNS